MTLYYLPLANMIHHCWGGKNTNKNIMNYPGKYRLFDMHCQTHKNDHFDNVIVYH